MNFAPPPMTRKQAELLLDYGLRQWPMCPPAKEFAWRAGYFRYRVRATTWRVILECKPHGRRGGWRLLHYRWH